jgi:hypothetical protein
MRMAEKTIVEKAGETIGVGIAMASDVAGAIKSAVTAATAVMKNAPAKKTVKAAARKAVTKKAAKKAPAKKVAEKASAKKTPTKKAGKKSVNKPAKKVGRMRR